MQIVIDIPEKDYNNIEPFLNGQMIKGGFNLFKALKIIKNGVPLPKGHGRLIDEDDLLDNTCIDEIPTIIEAESEGKE